MEKKVYALLRLQPIVDGSQGRKVREGRKAWCEHVVEEAWLLHSSQEEKEKAGGNKDSTSPLRKTLFSYHNFFKLGSTP